MRREGENRHTSPGSVKREVWKLASRMRGAGCRVRNRKEERGIGGGNRRFLSLLGSLNVTGNWNPYGHGRLEHWCSGAQGRNTDADAQKLTPVT